MDEQKQFETPFEEIENRLEWIAYKIESPTLARDVWRAGNQLPIDNAQKFEQVCNFASNAATAIAFEREFETLKSLYRRANLTKAEDERVRKDIATFLGVGLCEHMDSRFNAWVNSKVGHLHSVGKSRNDTVYGNELLEKYIPANEYELKIYGVENVTFTLDAHGAVIDRDYDSGLVTDEQMSISTFVLRTIHDTVYDIEHHIFDDEYTEKDNALYNQIYKENLATSSSLTKLLRDQLKLAEQYKSRTGKEMSEETRQLLDSSLAAIAVEDIEDDKKRMDDSLTF